MKLFLLPYAGGSAMFYSRFNRLLPSTIEVIPIELAGRGIRSNEPFYKNMNEAIEDIYVFITTNISDYDEEYALFGHSMGTLLCYEVYYKLCENNRKLPIHLFLSGAKPPHLPRGSKNISRLPEGLLKEELMKMGGTPREALNSKELMDYYLPIIRADFSMIEFYQYRSRPVKMSCDFTLLNGVDDTFYMEEIEQWGIHTNGSTSVYMFNGGHFYLTEYFEEISDIINRKLEVHSLDYV